MQPVDLTQFTNGQEYAVIPCKDGSGFYEIRSGKSGHTIGCKWTNRAFAEKYLFDYLNTYGKPKVPKHTQNILDKNDIVVDTRKAK